MAAAKKDDQGKAEEHKPTNLKESRAKKEPCVIGSWKYFDEKKNCMIRVAHATPAGKVPADVLKTIKDAGATVGPLPPEPEPGKLQDTIRGPKGHVA